MRAPTRHLLVAALAGIFTVAASVPSTGAVPSSSGGSACPTNPFPYGSVLKFDRDSDLILDVWEMTWGLNPNDPCDARQDDDRDGLTNLREYRLKIIPYAKDTDNDGLNDFYEVKVSRTDPNWWDTDNDGLLDRAELKQHQTNPKDADTDHDGISDGDEIKRGTNPHVPEPPTA